MNQVLRCDWLPEWARWSYLARSGLPDVTRKKNFLESHIINPLTTKLVQSRWLHIGLVVFVFYYFWTSTPPRSINTHKKKILANIQSSLPNKFGQLPILLTCQNKRCSFWYSCANFVERSTYVFPGICTSNILYQQRPFLQNSKSWMRRKAFTVPCPVCYVGRRISHWNTRQSGIWSLRYRYGIRHIGNCRGNWDKKR